MRSRLRQVPVTKTTQKLSSRLIKYGSIGAGLIGVAITCIVVYSNLGVSHDSLAGSTTTSSYAGSALKFNGSTDYVSIGKIKGQFSKTFSVMAWIKWDIDPSKGNASANIFSINSSSTVDDGVFWLQHNSNNSKFEFAVQTDNGRTAIQSTTPVQMGVWYHVAGVYDGNNIQIYVNGSKENSTTISGSIPKVAGDDYVITIGELATSPYRRFTGIIDEVSAWDNALSESNVRKYMATKVPDKQSGIIMNFNFDEGSDTKLSDSSSPYSGTVTGATWVTSGAPVSPENSYVVKNGTKNYTYTFKNGYSIQITNLSQDPSGVLFYSLESNSTLKTIFSKFDFNYGRLGFYIINGSAVTYTVKYTNPSLATSTKSLATASGFMVATQNSSDAATWSAQTLSTSDSKSSFSIASSSSRLETAVGDLVVAMPIVLEYFRGSSTPKNEVLLEWATVSEQNNDYFSVERSEDGKTFEVIKQINGAGNSTKKLYYDYTDFSPLQGTNYYRLKQTDYDGKFEYSKTIAVNILGGTAEIAYEIKDVYPNPFTDELNIAITTGSETPINVRLLNMKGAVMREETFTPAIGTNEFQLTDNGAVEKGLYILSVTQGDQLKIMRVAKK